MTKSGLTPTLANTARPWILGPVVWQEKRSFRFQIAITTDDYGIVSAVVLNLPGAGSCGSTEEEAMTNVKEAIRGVLEVYEVIGECITWKEPSAVEIPPGAKRRWITLD